MTKLLSFKLPAKTYIKNSERIVEDNRPVFFSFHKFILTPTAAITP